MHLYKFSISKCLILSRLGYESECAPDRKVSAYFPQQAYPIHSERGNVHDCAKIIERGEFYKTMFLLHE